MRSAQARLKQFGSSLTAVGSGLMGMSAAAAAPLVLATTQFASFESGMARVQALTNASEKDFASLSEEAKRLGRDTVYTATQAAQAMGVFALAGYQAGDIIKATGPALNLAAAGQMDLAQAADISMKVMSGMGIATEDLGGAIDVLAKAMTTANTDLIMLGEAFKYVGPVARSAGMSLEEVTAAIQILSDAGIQSDMAGTTLRGAILSLTSPSEEAKKALKQMGVQVIDAQGNFRGLTAIIADMEKAMSGLGSGTRLQLIGDVFANRQATGIATLIDRGSAEMRKKTASLGTAGKEGVAARIAGIQLDTLYGGFMLAVSAAEGLALVIGSALAPTLREWGNTLIGAVTLIRQIVDLNKEWVPVVAKTIVAVGAVGAGLFIIGTAAQVAAFALGGLAVAAGLLFSPTGLILAGVAAFATLTDAGQAMAAGVSEDLKALVATFSTTWAGIADAMSAGDVELANKVAWAGLKVVWAEGVAWLSGLWRATTGGLVDAWEVTVSAMALVVNDVWSGVESIWFESFALIGKAWGGLMDFMMRSYVRAAGMIEGGLIGLQLSVGAIDAGEAAKKMAGIAEWAQGMNAAIEERREGIDAQRDRDRRDIEARRKATEDALLEQHARERQARERVREAEAAGDKAAVDAAKGELAAAVAKAAELKQAAAWAKTGSWFGDFGGSAVTPKKLQMEGDRAMAGGTSQGTFNAAAIRSLVGGGMDVPRMQLEEAKRQNDNLKKILGEVRDNNIAFA